jgi:hypothetical protein
MTTAPLQLAEQGKQAFAAKQYDQAADIFAQAVSAFEALDDVTTAAEMKNNLSVEGYFSYDKSEKMAYIAEAGYLDYKYSQFNYNYASKGVFARFGVDFNLLKSETSKGKYWAGIGLRYGISLFNSETPSFQHENYWGTVTSSLPSKKSIGHFLEVAPGVKTEIFRNFSMGWTIRLNLLISGGEGKDHETYPSCQYRCESRILNIPTLFYELSYFLNKTDPGQTTYTLSNGFSVNQTFSSIFSGSARVAREDGLEEGYHQ